MTKKYALKIFNTLSRSIEDFIPLVPGEVKMYSCGPTVYDHAHIGNFRAYMFADLLKRTLKLIGLSVDQVMNITDVDDKTILNSKKSGEELSAYTSRFTEEFFKDLDSLGIDRAEHFPRATKHIPEMIDLVKKLQEKGFTYESDGSVYFSLSRFPDYGKLSHVDLEANIDGVHNDSDEYEKENVKDFALWKGKKEGEPFWEAPFGPGRPGWHLECSAMSMKYLGETFDIHTGGNDLVFPHHENEIAQSEGATGKPFVRFWLHNAHLVVDGQKMSKSAGNFFTLRDLLQKGSDVRAVRLILLSTHYRKKLNFTFQSLEEASKALQRYQDFFDHLQEITVQGDGFGDPLSLEDWKNRFTAELCDDLNISGALGIVFEFIRKMNKTLSSAAPNSAFHQALTETMRYFDRVLGLLKEKKQAPVLEAEIDAAILKRDQARQQKDWALADQIRDDLKAQGIILKDTPAGVKWSTKID